MKKKGLAVRLAAVLCLVMLTFSVPAMAKPGKVYICTANYVRVHASANASSRIIGRLSRGNKVMHVSSKNGWWLIKTKSGRRGYIDKRFLRRVA